MGIHDILISDPVQRNSTKKPTLLIVDDEEGPRESLKVVFKDMYHCATASTGGEGIKYAEQYPVDAAILDIRMPDLTGIEVLQRLKEIDSNIECVMLTGYETVDTARAAVRFGAADYLNKPFDVFAMRELIQKCMARRLSRKSVATQLETLERENEEMSRELADTKRAVTASVLSAGVVHEMNNPLAIISGYAELLKRDLAALGKNDHTTAGHLQEGLSLIQREIVRCKEIAQRFLTFARSAGSEPQVIPVARLLEDAVSLIRAHPSRRRVEVTGFNADRTLKTEAYPTELLQVLINLGVNALQAMDGVGTLTLSAEACTEMPVRFPMRSDAFDPTKPHIRIDIRDTGPGIPAETLPHIFDPYFTTKEKGTGLGLAIVCKLVANCDGALTVQSAVGLGTTFSLYLPRVE